MPGLVASAECKAQSYFFHFPLCSLMLNAGQNGMNVRLLRAGHETGKFHVVDETLT